MIVLLLSVLMNGSEVKASRIIKTLAPVSAGNLSRCSSWLTMRLNTYEDELASVPFGNVFLFYLTFSGEEMKVKFTKNET
jgi:hypothetical protein